MRSLSGRGLEGMQASIHEIDRTTGALEVLLLLHSNGPASLTKVTRSARPGREAIERSLDVLLKLQLVECNHLATFPFTKLYGLSPLGGRIVESPLLDWPSILVPDQHIRMP